MAQRIKFATSIIFPTFYFRSFSTWAIEHLVFRLRSKRENTRPRYQGKKDIVRQAIIKGNF